MRKTKDIETALYEQFTDDGYSASCHAIPSTLGQNMPHIHIVRTGGYEADLVVETNYIDFDVYADNDADCMAIASHLCGYVRDIPWAYMSEISTLPYHNPDPRHPSVARVTFKAQIVTRTED